MKFAWDELANKGISADDVVERHRPYRCGNCKARVYFNRGNWREAHFKHYPGEGKSDCDLYSPWSGTGYAGRTAFHPASRTQRESVRYASLTLCINANDKASWRLFLLLPPSGSYAGEISVRVAKNDLRVIPISSLHSTTRHIAVAPGDFTIGFVSASKDVDVSYLNRIRASETMLNAGGVTAFQVSDWDRYYRRAGKLFWGSSYYFILRAGARATIPKALRPEALLPRDDHECYLVTLPENPNDAVAKWCLDNTGLSLHERRAKVTLIYPDIQKIDNGLPRQLSRGDEALVLVQRETPASDISNEIWIETNSGPAVLDMPAEKCTVVSMPINRNDALLYLRCGDEPGMLFRIGELELNMGDVRAEICVTDSRSTISAPFYSEAARALMLRVRRGRAKGVEISLTGCPPPRIMKRASYARPWSDPIDDVDLCTLLEDATTDLIVDLGPLGYHRFKANASAAEGSARVLPELARGTLKWLLSHYHDGVRALSTSHDDAVLIHALQAVALKRQHLAHYRYLLQCWNNAANPVGSNG